MTLKDKMRIKYGYDTDKLVEALNEKDYNYCKHIKHLEYIHNKADGYAFFKIKINSIIADSDNGAINFLMELAEELGLEVESITTKNN